MFWEKPFDFSAAFSSGQNEEMPIPKWSWGDSVTISKGSSKWHVGSDFAIIHAAD